MTILTRKWPGLAPGIALILLGAFALLAWNAERPRSSGVDRAIRTGEAYGRTNLAWLQGPSVQSTRIVRLDELDTALRSMVPARTRQDINTAQLLGRYGLTRRVAIVVFHGMYNTLPPDEGVNVTGDIVVLVDVATNKVILGTG